jgi:mRNA-degrading endonuclease RelE of RelBE toxin-antitoxin system
MRYTVVWHKKAHDELASLWLAATDRAAVSAAANAIDAQLAVDAHKKGIDVGEGLRQLTVPPLRVIYSANQNDRLVWVANVYVD